MIILSMMKSALNRVTGVVSLTTSLLGAVVSVKSFLVSARYLERPLVATWLLTGHIGFTWKLAQLSSSYSSIASLPSLASSSHASTAATSSPSSMNLSPRPFLASPRPFLLSKTPMHKMWRRQLHSLTSSEITPTMVSSVSSCSNGNATFSMANYHVRVGSLSSHVNVQSLRHFCTSSDTDQEETFIDQEASLIDELCSEIVDLYHSYQKLSLFPSLRPFDIEEIRRLVLSGDYHFSSLEILSFPKEEYITAPLIRKRDPDYPDVHLRYNASDNLVYVIKPTSPQDCLVFLALANTLYSFIHGFLYNVRMANLFYLINCEPVDLLYKIDLTPSYSRLKKDVLFRSLKHQLELEIPYENPFLEAEIPDERLFYSLEREKRVMAYKQVFSMLESISNLPITKGDPFQGSIPPEWGLPPVGGKLYNVLLDVILTDWFDPQFSKAFPNFFRNQHEVFIPILSNSKKNPSIDINELDKFLQKIGLRGAISSISRAKGYFPLGFGLYDDDCSDNILIIMPNGKFKLVDSRDYFDFDF